MLIIQGDDFKVGSMMKEFGGFLDIAAINSREQTVVAGDSEIVMEFKGFCERGNLRCTLLPATHAFHSKHMDGILGEYETVAKGVRRGEGQRCQYISGMEGKVLGGNEIGWKYWGRHTRDKVNFLGASKMAVEEGCRIFIEIGSQPVLCAMTMMNNENGNIVCLPSLRRNKDDWETIGSSVGRLYLSGIEIDWNGWDGFYEKRKVVDSLPKYPFVGKKFWPEGLDGGRDKVEVHPLIGSRFGNASGLKIFENWVKPEGNLGYIKDHCIGQTVVFPGACFVDMCLAAGAGTVGGLNLNGRGMKVENFRIQAPLGLQEGRGSQLQTISELGRDGDVKVKIFHRSNGLNVEKWVEHGAASFLPILTVEEQQVDFEVERFKRILSTEGSNKVLQLYERLVSVGLKFGPKFKSLERIWREGEGDLVGKVTVPDNCGEYIVHPIILDAMIQVMIFEKLFSQNLKAKLFVPISIGKVIWMGEGVENLESLYVYASSKENKVLLVDEEGRVKCVMINVEFIGTTAKAVEAVLQEQTAVMPSMWEECWRNKLGPNQYRLDLAVCRKEQFLDDKLDLDKYGIVNGVKEETFRELEQLVYLNILRCLYELGWAPQLNETFSLISLTEKLGVEQSKRKMLNYMLDVLEEERVLKKGMREKETEALYQVVSQPLSASEIEERLNSSRFREDLVKTFKSTCVLNELGTKYSSILKGKLSALQILFPEENLSKAKELTVQDFQSEYTKLFNIQNMHLDVAASQLRHFKKHGQPDQKTILRILEVGVGYGSFTQEYFSILLENGFEVDYTFTDTSPVYFTEVQKRLENYSKFITFSKLDIESCPIDQGLIPNHYDYVICNDVIHKTTNLKKTLANVRTFLRPNGIFVMAEQTRRNRIMTFLFGTLDDFWKFTDFDIRPDHPTLSTEKWKDTLELCGLNVLQSFSTLNNYHSVFYSSKNSDFKLPLKLAQQIRQKYWIIFHNEESPTSQYILDQLSTLAIIVVVRKSNQFECCKTQGIWNVQLEPNSEQDFKQLISHFVDKNLEGIVYSWALEKSNSSSQISQQSTILQPYFYMIQAVLQSKLKSSPKIFTLLTRVMPAREDINLENFPTSTIWGFTKSLRNECMEVFCRCIDIGESDTVLAAEQVYYELWNKDKETDICYLDDNARYYWKLQPVKNTSLKPLHLPIGSEDRFILKLPETRAIADLEFIPLPPFVLEEYEVEVEVKASALNFRDILSILKPSAEFDNVSMVGFDFAGRIKRIGSGVSKFSVGDPVFGLNLKGGPLPSHVKLDENALVRLPQNISFRDACAMPAVMMTSYYCLVDVAKITRDDVVLIHTASGGVGLPAIKFCQEVGATIIVTVGSRRKRSYLKSLGIKYIFNSRTTQYADEILRVTNGQGVNVVLNSLTSEGFKEATLRACAKNARFVEMSRLSIWSKEEVRERRPDVTYTTVDLTRLEESELRRLLIILSRLVDEGKVTETVTNTRFDAVHIRQALEYIHKAKHVGKVVCIMPESKVEKGSSTVHTPMFNDCGTYLITGGLGGIGFFVCEWMVGNGAKHLVLAGRSAPNESVLKAINVLKKEKGANIACVQVDIGDYEECRELIEHKIGLMNMPILKGVMHAAGTLKDGLIENQSWDSLSSTFRTKVDGSWNLHELTKGLNLEHFVLFSSMAASFGSPGQSNHAAGNTFEDMLAHYRHSIGLPATTVNWGQWGEVGIATEVDIPGLKPLSNLQAISGLEYALKAQRLQTVIFNAESFQLLSRFFPQVSNIVDEQVWKNSTREKTLGTNSNSAIQSEKFWRKYDGLDKTTEKVDLIKETLQSLIKVILRVDESDVIETNVSFQEMGVDSLMFVEMKNSIQMVLGSRATISVSSMKDCNTIDLLAKAINNLIEGDTSNSEETVPTFAEVAQLIQKDCQLDDHIRYQSTQTQIDIQNVSQVLLTGCSGTLGPYILKELTNMDQIEKVVCLMRPSKVMSGEERLQKILQDRDLLSQIDMSKISCVNGNVSQTNLGLGPILWNELQDEIDAVFHCATNAHHIELYKERNSDTDVRAVNIQGTKNVLEFASAGAKLKHVYCASSMLSTVTLDQDNNLSENWPEARDYDGVTYFAYPISKFVGDLLMKEAILERGIPGKVFRFPLMIGDSKSGRFLMTNNHAMLRYMFILQHGVMPSNPLPLVMLPVDICAWASVKVFFSRDAPNDVFNVSNLTPAPEQEFIEVAQRLGYKVDLVEFAEFTDKIRSSQNSQYALFADFYKSDEDLLSVYSTAPALKEWIVGGGSNENFMVSRKIAKILPEFYEKPVPIMDHLYQDLLFAKQQGWLENLNV